MTDTTVAEVAILGVVMSHPQHAAEIFARVQISDFTGPQSVIAEAVYGLRVKGEAHDPLAVVQEMTRRGSLGRAGGAAFVMRVAASAYEEPALESYVGAVVREVRLRRLAVVGARLGQQVQAGDADPHVIAAGVVEAAQGIVDAVEGDGDVTTPTLREFLDAPEAPFDWVIPGLLERGDRMILTGSEGLGKSVLFRQIAVSAAAGSHPFGRGPFAPQRVLYVDAENSVGHLRRELRALAVTARTRAGGAEDTLFLECRPEGLDLTDPADEAWLVKRVAALQPSLLLTGPLYRLHADDPNKEQPARQVARVLDRCRAVAHCAVVVEAHAGHGTGHQGERNVRPTGSSLWLRWPEFGYGMRAGDDYSPEDRRVDLVPWRGDRAVREWPRKLAAGGPWPWSQVDNFSQVRAS